VLPNDEERLQEVLALVQAKRPIEEIRRLVSPTPAQTAPRAAQPGFLEFLGQQAESVMQRLMPNPEQERIRAQYEQTMRQNRLRQGAPR
jgi:DNA-binding transcriptional MerR regulator